MTIQRLLSDYVHGETFEKPHFGNLEAILDQINKLMASLNTAIAAILEETIYKHFSAINTNAVF